MIPARRGWGSVGWALPYCAKGKMKAGAQWGNSDPMIEADAPSTGRMLASVPTPPGVVMVAPPRVLRNAWGRKVEGPRQVRWGEPARPRAGVVHLEISPARKCRARGRIEQTLLDGACRPHPHRPKTFAR